ncbi:hypothetical protein HPB47_018187, partial [Ixodes persulcatus]
CDDDLLQTLGELLDVGLGRLAVGGRSRVQGCWLLWSHGNIGDDDGGVTCHHGDGQRGKSEKFVISSREVTPIPPALLLLDDSSSSSCSSSSSSSSGSSSSDDKDRLYVEHQFDCLFAPPQKRPKIETYLDTVHLHSDNEFRRNFRLMRPIAYELIDNFGASPMFPPATHGGSPAKTPEEQVLSYLWTIVHLKRSFHHCLHTEPELLPECCYTTPVACCVMHNIAQNYSCDYGNCNLPPRVLLPPSPPEADDGVAQ